MKKIFIATSLIVLVVLNPYLINAEGTAPGKCKMTIQSDKHHFNNRTSASGDCAGLVEGYYLAEDGSFTIIGSVNLPVTKSGQTFTVPTPKHPSGESVLTVYLKKTKPKEEPKPQTKSEEPKQEVKQEPKQKPKQETNKKAKKETKQVSKDEPKKETKQVSKDEPKKESKSNSKQVEAKEETKKEPKIKPSSTSSTNASTSTASSSTSKGNATSKDDSTTNSKSSSAKKDDEVKEKNLEKIKKDKNDDINVSKNDNGKKQNNDTKVSKEDNERQLNTLEESKSKQSDSTSSTGIWVISFLLLVSLIIFGYWWYRKRKVN